MNLESTKVLIKGWVSELEEKICPVVQKACIQEKCWRFKKEEKVAWGETEGVRDKLTKRVSDKPTGKVIIGTQISCLDNIFPNVRLSEARYALDTEAKIKDFKTMEVLNPDGSPYGGFESDQEIISIKDMEEDEDKEIKSEIEDIEDEYEEDIKASKEVNKELGIDKEKTIKDDFDDEIEENKKTISKKVVEKEKRVVKEDADDLEALQKAQEDSFKEEELEEFDEDNL